jgi:hypothetical protein
MSHSLLSRLSYPLFFMWALISSYFGTEARARLIKIIYFYISVCVYIYSYSNKLYILNTTHERIEGTQVMYIKP